MNANLLRHWKRKKEKLKQKFPFLTDKDLRFREGEEKEMIELLGSKIGKTKQELLNIILML